jgi:predicted metalloendopeptidase
MKERDVFMKTTGVALLSVLLAASALGTIAMETASEPARAAAVVTAAKKPFFGNWGVDLAGMDRSVKPGDDFFRYVNGAWYDKAVIPADRTSTGSFLDLDIQSEDRVRGMMAELEARKDKLSPEDKRVYDLYHSYADSARIEQLGLKPAEKDLQQIASVKSLDDVRRVMGSVHWARRACSVPASASTTRSRRPTPSSSINPAWASRPRLLPAG